MKIDFLTLFPNMYDGFLSESIISRAVTNKKVEINIHNFRDYSKDVHKKTDDTPYGGGSGMVLMCQPIFDCVNSIKTEKSKVIMLTPDGETFNQEMAYDLASESHLIFLAGHYEGFDERIKSIVDREVSIGDYVLTGGELPSMVMADAIIRLVPGVILEDSHLKESFNNDTLDYPTYTKPRVFAGMEVPEVLLNGDHKKIENFREESSLMKTLEKRPDIDLKKGISNFYVVRDNKSKEVFYVEFEKMTGYDITPKNKIPSKDMIKVSKMILVKPSLIEKLLRKKIDIKIQHLFNRIFSFLETDGNIEGTNLLLDETDHLAVLVRNNYSEFLGDEEIKETLRKLSILSQELKKNQLMHFDMEKNLETGKSR